MQELKTGYGLTPSVLIAAASYDADTTPVAIDCAGYNAAIISLAIGAGGITFSTTNKIEFVLEHSNDSETWADVTTADMIGVTVTDGIIRSLVAAKAAADVVNYAYQGNRRYLRLTADFSGTHGAATPIAATLLRGNPTVPVA
jgi:hypothetical protein